MSKEELLKGLTEEQIEKVQKCKNLDEIMDLAKSEGIELTDEQLSVVSGGGCRNVEFCPSCGSDNICLASNRTGSDCGKTLYYCRNCQSYFLYEGEG